MTTTNTHLETSSFRLPTLSWPLTACLSAALIISVVPGCEDKPFEKEQSLDTRAAEQEEQRELPLMDSRTQATRGEAFAGKESATVMRLPGVDETGEELLFPDPLRTPHDDDPSIDHLAKGQAALDANDSSTAMDLFRKAAFSTDSYAAFQGLGRAARLAGDKDLAIEAFAMAAKTNSSAAEPLVMAARLSLEAGDIDMGHAFINRAIAREPKRADAHNVLGRLCMAEQQYHRAVLSFQRATEIDPSFVWAWNNKGYVKLLTGKYDEAVEALETAVALSPVTAYMHNNLGLAYLRAGKTKEARSAFEEALSLRPGYVNATINLDRVKTEMTAIAEAESEGPEVGEDGALEYVPGG